MSRERLLGSEFNRSKLYFNFAIDVFRIAVVDIHDIFVSFLLFGCLFIGESLAEWFLVLESCLYFGNGLGNISNNALIRLLFKQGE